MCDKTVSETEIGSMLESNECVRVEHSDGSESFVRTGDDGPEIGYMMKGVDKLNVYIPTACTLVSSAAGSDVSPVPIDETPFNDGTPVYQGS